MKRLVLVLLLMFLVISGCGSGLKAGRQAPGVEAPGFTLPSLYTGERISLADLRGHPVLLMFFSPG